MLFYNFLVTISQSAATECQKRTETLGSDSGERRARLRLRWAEAQPPAHSQVVTGYWLRLLDLGTKSIWGIIGALLQKKNKHLEEFSEAGQVLRVWWSLGHVLAPTVRSGFTVAF